MHMLSLDEQDLSILSLLEDEDNLFHVHTYRCEHSDIKEEKVIEKAIDYGFRTITFTDHAPFPGNPFGSRMDYEDLGEYISSLNSLKEKYKDRINVVAGLEAEYFPSFDKQDYYESLKDKGVELTILGQHMAEMADKSYTFGLKDRSVEYPYLAEAIIQGLNTGKFKILAHPDRIFLRSRKRWNDEMTDLSKRTIETAISNNGMLEYNIAGPIREFWEIVEKYEKSNCIRVIKGYDLHYMYELENLCKGKN